MRPDVVLVDVYETILTCDFDEHRHELPRRIGVDHQTWDRSFRTVGDEMLDGRMSMHEAFAEVVRRCGLADDDELIAELVDLDRALLRRNVTVFADTRPFLLTLREDGYRTAFVSNCAENTRPLLMELGLLDLVDVAVLSNEVGVAKPDRRIFETALDRLGARPHQAVLIDDQHPYCEGAEAIGIAAIRIDRTAQGAADDRRVATLEDARQRLRERRRPGRST